MEPTPKPHVSHAIAWSLIALFAGSLAFGIWMYSNQIDTIYTGSTTISVTHKKTATKPTTATTGTTITTDATADWTTYTNTKYGYTMKYPSHLEPGIVGTTASAGPTDDNAVFSEGGNSKDSIEISVQTGKTIDQLVAETRTNYEKDYNTVAVTDTTIGGQPAKKIVRSNPKDAEDFGDTTIYVQKGSNIFKISSDSHLLDFETILSTFTFTK